MTKIRIINTVTGELKDIDCVGYNLQYVEANGRKSIENKAHSPS